MEPFTLEYPTSLLASRRETGKSLKFVAPPVKSRELHNHHFDSTVWNDFLFRDNDIIIATYAKSGTTWMQQIVGQLLFGPDPKLPVAELSPWIDLRIPSKQEKLAEVERQTHRRFLKTHLPVDALVFSSQAKYIYIGRDARDVVWSLHNHHLKANALWYKMLNDTPGLVGPPIEPPKVGIVEYWCDWLSRDGYPFWSYWENVRTWWEIKELSNVLFVHFEDLCKDMEAEIRRVAAFLGVDISDRDAEWERILKYCSFDWMKMNGAPALPLNGAFWDDGSHAFINKGKNGRWRGLLSEDQIRNFETRAIEELGSECYRWTCGIPTIP